MHQGPTFETIFWSATPLYTGETACANLSGMLGISPPADLLCRRFLALAGFGTGRTRIVLWVSERKHSSPGWRWPAGAAPRTHRALLEGDGPTPSSGPLLACLLLPLSGDSCYFSVLTSSLHPLPTFGHPSGNGPVVCFVSGTFRAATSPRSASPPTAVSTPGNRPGNGFTDNGRANPPSLDNLSAQTPNSNAGCRSSTG